MGQWIHLGFVTLWNEKRTRAGAYYKLSAEARRRFRRQLQAHRAMLMPILWLLARSMRIDLKKLVFQFQGIPLPKGTCTPAKVQEAVAYKPSHEDIFVVAPMRCGTTWMQHLVYQVVMRGTGDLADRGISLFAISAWLESTRGIPVNEAPIVGLGRPSRIIKTHLPAELLPLDPCAKYVYVVRHPVSCFASCVDFLRQNLGPFQLGLQELELWFCSDEAMWWGTWPQHVAGWWKRAQEGSNILVISFEEMKLDLLGVIYRLAGFLEVESLSTREVAEIARKCSFEYMRRYQQSFEMVPPHFLQNDHAFLRSGALHRYQALPEATRRRIADWCRQEVASRSFPWQQWYPDMGDRPLPAQTSLEAG